MTSASGEQCVVVEDGTVFDNGAELAIVPCLVAIAAGDGREVFHFSEDGQIVNTVGVIALTTLHVGGAERLSFLVLSSGQMCNLGGW